MRKAICLILAVLLALSLCACGGQKEQGFRVGFGRADITPKQPVSLHGYFELRQSTGVLNKLYATCVALSDGSNTVLMYTVDIIGMNDVAGEYMEKVSEATGIPASNIVASATHTHSGPSNQTDNFYWENQFYPAMVQAAEDALADLSTAQIYAGDTRTDRMNFVRHYMTANGVVVGDNFGDPAENGGIVGHATESDNQMQLIRFVREDKKDILLINWQGHPKTASTSETATGLQHRSFISSDYIGFLRDNLEAEQADLQVAFYLGASGNLNVFSRLDNERDNAPADFMVFGRNLTKVVSDALPTLRLVENTQPAVKNEKKIIEAPNKSGNVTIPCNVSTIVAGDISFVSVPYEMFDTNGMYVKENSPTKITFIMTCSDGYLSYVPSDYAYSYSGDCYEVRSSKLGKGGAEMLAAEMVNMLNDLAENADNQ